MKVNTFCSLNGSTGKLDLNERIFKTCNLVLNPTCCTSILLLYDDPTRRTNIPSINFLNLGRKWIIYWLKLTCDNLYFL